MNRKPIVNFRQEGEDLIVTAALVTNRKDRHNTIIEPDGCNTDFRSVMVDVNHDGKQTTALLTNKRIEKIKLDSGEEVEALLGDFIVKPGQEIEDRDGNTGDLMELIKSGEIRTVSVYFDPLELYESVKDSFVRFVKWSLNAVSFLWNEIPGQEDGFILNVQTRLVNKPPLYRRVNNLNLINQKMSKNKKPLKDKSEKKEKRIIDKKTKKNSGEDKNIKKNERNFLGDLVENTSGELFMIIGVNEEMDGEMEGIMYTLESRSGETIDISQSDFENGNYKYANLSDIIFEMMKGERKSDNEKREMDKEKREEWTVEFINSLPDSAFVVIEPAYMDGETEDKNARHLPYRNEEGEIDMPHLTNAVARHSEIKPITDSISEGDLVSQARANLMDIIESEGLTENFPSLFEEEDEDAEEDRESVEEEKRILENLKKENRDLKKTIRLLHNSPEIEEDGSEDATFDNLKNIKGEDAEKKSTKTKEELYEQSELNKLNFK